MALSYNYPGTAEAIIQDSPEGTVFEKYALIFVEAAGDDEAEEILLGDSSGQFRQEIEEELRLCRNRLDRESFMMAKERYGPVFGLTEFMKNPLIMSAARERTVSWFADYLFECYKIHENTYLYLFGGGVDSSD